MQPVEEFPILPPDVEVLIQELQRVLSNYGFRLNRVIPKDGSEGLTAYLTATKPTNSPPGAIIYVSDGGAGNVFQGWNGVAWVPLG